MSGLGGLNPSAKGVVIGLVQAQSLNISTPAELDASVERSVSLVAKAKRFNLRMDMIVFPEYHLHGLSMSTDESIMVQDGSAITERLRQACVENDIWACYSIMEKNASGNPYNTALIYDNKGDLKLKYRKLHPWVPAEPWEPGNTGLPVFAGPKGYTYGIGICHDGMFPEVAREIAYKGAQVMLRTAGYTYEIRRAWRVTNQANALQNLMATASVCLGGSNGTKSSMGEAMFVGHEGNILEQTQHNIPDEILACELRPDLIQEARESWAFENNLYQLGHRAYVAVQGGVSDCPYTFMHDLAKGQYRLPYEDKVHVRDGTAHGFPPPRPSP